MPACSPGLQQGNPRVSSRPSSQAVALRAQVLDSASSLKTNSRITQGYLQLAGQLQRVVDPGFQPGLPSRVLANWFAFAPHAAVEVGKGMLGANLARAIIDAAQGEPAPSLQYALDRGGLAGPERWFGLTHDVAASLGAHAGATAARRQRGHLRGRSPGLGRGPGSMPSSSATATRRRCGPYPSPSWSRCRCWRAPEAHRVDEPGSPPGLRGGASGCISR